MIVRKSANNDLPSIMKIIHEAQQYLASQNIDQWQDGYPDETMILNDIQNKESFIVLDNEEIVATYVLSINGDENYDVIEGNWLTDDLTAYGVIHRIAVAKSNTKKGIAKHIILECEKQLKYSGITTMRIDTHKDNKGMQHILKTLGYSYCGIIKLKRGGDRLAFEKLIL